MLQRSIQVDCLRRCRGGDHDRQNEQ
jgi:hypothetical protein